MTTTIDGENKMKRLLIADDSLFLRNVIKKILTQNGYEVIGEAENGKIALQKYKELKPDAVTLDITMDEMDGLEALREILKYDSNAKVIMVSAMSQDAFIAEAINAGAKGFLTKPFKEKMVISTISKLF